MRKSLHSKTAHVPGFSTEAAFFALFARSKYAFWLDSSRVMAGYSRFSIMGDAGGPLAEVISYHLRDRRISINSTYGTKTEQGDLFEYMRQVLAERHIGAQGLPFNFNLGYVGYFGYEMKALCDGSAAHEAGTPGAAFIFCDRALVFDHETCEITLLSLTQDDQWFAETQATLNSLPLQGGGLGRGVIVRSAPAPHLTSALRRGEFTPRQNAEQYKALIAECQEHIRAGNAYEICLTNQFMAKAEIDPLEAYLRLRERNPAPYAAYMRFSDTHILCSSPERFLAIDAAGNVESKPIKGTARRGVTPEEDGALRAQLAESAKDRAENLMIVDLLRNDLSRVCEPGSVRVPELFAVESYATVHQLVSTIRGRLRAGQSAIDCIRAAFPGGSMTGAPKRRAMEIIDTLEGGPRGIYSGALGWLSLSGAVDLNIVIRTLVATPDSLSLGAGGAITVDSDPAKEWEEALLKAQSVLAAV